jgi:hypothetical protein
VFAFRIGNGAQLGADVVRDRRQQPILSILLTEKLAPTEGRRSVSQKVCDNVLHILSFGYAVFMPRPFPAIPPILATDLLKAVSALVHAAQSYRVVLIAAAAAEPNVSDVMEENEELLGLSDTVINAWRKQLGHDVEDEDGLP